MIGTPKRLIRTVSCFLIIAIICGILPWRELRADADTHGGYESYPFSISYEQNSTWNNSTQGQFTITNTSDYSVYSWTLEIDYFEDVIISSIWDASDITDYDIDENIKVSGAVSIPAGGTYTFGLIADGTETAPVSPISVNVIQYESDEPQEAPTNEPTPEITDEPIPIEEPVVTEVPDQDEEAEPTVFPYAIFSGSTEDDFSFQGWKSEITGDIYSGRDFLYQGSELYMEGYARTVGTVQPAGWITDMTGVEEGIDPLPMPDWSEAIEAKEDMMPTIAPDAFTSQNSIIVNGYYYVDDDLMINSSSFSGEGDVVIVASGNITYNVDTLAPDNEEDEQTGKILLYSEEGNITINGTQIEINGIVYAPEGSVTINAYDTTINGRIVADRFSYSGSILNVTADPSDLELVYDLPDVTVTALQNQHYIGETVSFRIEIPTDNVYEIKYRLNGEDVEVEIPDDEDEPIIYSFVPDTEGTYTFEAYVELPYGEFVLDSDSVTIVPEPTLSPTETPTTEPTEPITPTPTEEPTPTLTDTPVPTEEPTVTPEPSVTEIPLPTDFPQYSDVTYTSVMSQGDTRYGYETEFIEEDWDVRTNTTLTPTIINLTNGGTYRNGYAFFNTPQHIDDDYSFSVRYTYNIDEQNSPSSDGIAFVIQTDSVNTTPMSGRGRDIGYQGLNPSIEIESDVYQNGSEINNHHIGLMFNGISKTHYAIADYPQLRDNDAVHTMWIDYDGINDMLYVYVATYGEDVDLQKPSEPVITYNIDITEVFGDVDEVYMGFTSASGAYRARSNVIGMEYGTVEFVTPTIGMATNIYYIEPGEPIIGDGVIHGTDATVQLIDQTGNVVYTEELDPSGEFERLFVIETDGLEEGSYTLIVEAVSEEGELITKEIPVIITSVPFPTVAPDPSLVEFTDEELFVDILDEQDGEEITFITDIIGTVSGSCLQEYTFEVFPVGSDEPVYSAGGDAAIEEGVLGTVDSTLLINGYYRIVATAFAENGFIEDEIIVLVRGNAKIGNFTISFRDITLPVAGLPVEVYRTYDSRQRTEQGDFGYGWTMSVGGPEISVSDSLGEDWGTEKRTVLGVPMYYWDEIHPHEVYIDWGNGSEETFSLVLSPERTVNADNWIGISAEFENTSGNGDTLEIIDEHSNLLYADNCLYYLSDFSVFAPQDFLLTRYDGFKFYFNIDAGLYRIEDTYGRTIDITEDGIEYSEGGMISFTRDDDGRITAVSDGLGNTVSYTYDENGDLISVNDAAGYDTEFSYDEDHYLTDITADNGTTIARNEYDDDGRLVATIDADGRRIEFDHELGDRYEVVTDRLGNATVYYYDERGNVISVTDANDHTTTYEYDSNNNKTSETRPDGTTFSYSYDNNGNLLTATDSNGREITSSYGSNGELLTMSAMGVTELTMAYDSHGNLISATDSSGNTQDYGYDSTGNLTSVTDSLGTLMNMSYDSNGNVTSITNAQGEVTNFSYDSEGRLISRTITYQGTTLTDTYTYDAANRVTGITYANGNTVSYSYNQAGDVTSSTDSQGRTVNYSYDVYGNLTYISYPDGTSESFSYDAEGNNTSATDRMGRTVTFTYDAVGNCTSKTYDSGLSESYSYDSCDRVISSTNVYGSTTTYGYDYLGRNTSVTDGLGNTTSYTYNDRGNVSSVTDANGNTYSFTYDNNGNQTSVTYPNGSTYCSTYDARGRITSQSDAYGNITTYSYDSMDRLISVTDALGGTWSYGYDSLGNVTSVTDANGNITTYGYDLNGQVTSVTNATGNIATTTYDQYGRVISATDFGGTETTYTYDSMDRVLTETIGDEVTTYSYSEDGKLLSVTDPTGTITYTYNSRGFLSSVTNAAGETISYEYNSADQLQKITIDGQNICYGYDSLGRLVSVTDSEGTTTYTYDAVGNRASTTYPNGVVTTYEYNNINALTSLVTTDSNGTILASYEYIIGSNGERLSVEELGRTVEYTYDELNRLTSETVIVGDNEYETTYSYDSNSNRISMTKDGETTTYDYNSLNQVTRAGDIDYTWDNAGNLVSQSSLGTTLATYTYDSRNRMIAATVNGLHGTITETYTYDYLGNRTSKTTDGETTYFTTDLSSGYSQVLKAMTGTEAVYYTRGFELISRREGTTASYYLMDGGLSVRGLTNEDGVVTDTFVFDAFGNEVSRTGTTDNSYGFQGEEKDATGLYYLRARYMDPLTGAFITMDTYAGSLSDPMSLHKYLFANSNPIKYCDPSGFMSETEEMAVVSMICILSAAALSLINTLTYKTKSDGFFGLFSKSINSLIGLIIVGVVFIVILAVVLFTIAIWTIDYLLPSISYWDEYDDYETPSRSSRSGSRNYHNTPNNNKKQNDQFWEAMRRVGKILGNPVTKEFAERVHREISHQDLSLEEIVEWALSLLGR